MRAARRRSRQGVVGLAAVLIAGCAAQGSAQQGAVNARIERAESRIVGIQKEVQQRVYQRLDAQRDAISRTVQTHGVTGMELAIGVVGVILAQELKYFVMRRRAK